MVRNLWHTYLQYSIKAIILCSSSTWTWKCFYVIATRDQFLGFMVGCNGCGALQARVVFIHFPGNPNFTYVCVSRKTQG